MPTGSTYDRRTGLAQMEHDLGTRPRHHGVDRREGAYVTELRIDPLLDAARAKRLGEVVDGSANPVTRAPTGRATD